MVDRYTKLVLTVIAACLVYLSILQTRGPAAYAEGEFQRVVIVGWQGYDNSPTDRAVRDLRRLPLPVKQQP
jgi:hypothetical protein